ncbi:hypothetical protein A1QO_02480 [Vibrio genomosp. F10 str. ZF-129]|uniref:Tyr recombinase domain-containing protein n=1 Tax=Vibrio genomosp. F10 str. ZF-129 TaxID=1187848 RepID=A0A1E5BK70_9VIBR|nr:site-specific integrase [Vibrio genomosp. F10]OEE38263.1 hypothetical protein A1QO_02480 [Vibrio genomosp. F10 str. ZF-129]
MALPPVIDNQAWLFKVTKNQSPDPEMSLCLLGFFLGTGLRTIEISRIQTEDIIRKDGRINKSFEVRSEMPRTVYLVNPKLIKFIENYVSVRAVDGNHPDRFCGFEPTASFFTRSRYGEFKILSKRSASDKVSYYSPSLNNYIKRLLRNGGVESPSVETGRRTFALKLKGRVDVPSIHKSLGNRDINTTKKLLATDPISMKQLAELAF